MKNVLFVTLDGLRYDRLGLGGHRPSPSPTLDKLSEEGLCLDNIFSAGCATQFALPSLFTSTLPLDNGGYERGIQKREKSFVEVLKDHGYKSAGFFSAYYGTSFFCYDRGFDEFHEFISPRFIQGNILRNYLGHLKQNYKKGEKTLDECVSYLNKYLTDYFNWKIRYLDEKEKELNEGTVIISPLLHGWDFQKIRRIVVRELDRLRSDPKTYVKGILEDGDGSEFWSQTFGRSEMSAHGLSAHRKRFFEKNSLQFRTLGEVLMGRIRTYEQIRELERIVVRVPDRVASGAYMVDSVVKWLDENRARERPFFVWAHLMDIHDGRFFTNDVDQSREERKQEMQGLKSQLRAIQSKGSEYSSKITKDLAIRYVDMQVNRLVQYLKDHDLYDDTLIVISSDHGSRSSGAPKRESIDISDFYDEMYHIPAIFVGPGVKPGKLAGYFSSMDIGPTILSFLDIPVDQSFKGQSVLKNEGGRPHLVFEDLGRGPSDFTTRPIKVCVRSGANKLVYSVHPSERPEQGQVVQYFQLEDDKDEMKNMASEFEAIGEKDLKDLAIDRVREIRAGLK